MKRIDITGEKYNLLTVIGVHEVKNGKVYWDCLCDCGQNTVVLGSNLKNGSVKSCGCLTHKPSVRRTHNESKTKLYRHWKSMMYRCYNEKNSAYKWYGKRGIRVCKEWQSYDGFKKWVNETKPCEGYTVERIDVNGDYCPNNCTWIPINEQAKNRTTTVIIDFNGEKNSLTDWCIKLGLDYKRVHNRIYKLGWSFEKAISEPVDVKKRNKKG